MVRFTLYGQRSDRCPVRRKPNKTIAIRTIGQDPRAARGTGKQLSEDAPSTLYRERSRWIGPFRSVLLPLGALVHGRDRKNFRGYVHRFTVATEKTFAKALDGRIGRYKVRSIPDRKRRSAERIPGWRSPMDTMIRVALMIGAMFLASVAIQTCMAPIVMVGIVMMIVSSLVLAGEVYVMSTTFADGALSIRPLAWRTMRRIRALGYILADALETVRDLAAHAWRFLLSLIPVRTPSIVVSHAATRDRLATALREMIHAYREGDYEGAIDAACDVGAACLALQPTIRVATCHGRILATMRDAPRIGHGRAVLSALGSIHAATLGTIPTWIDGRADRVGVTRAAVATVHAIVPAAHARPDRWATTVDAVAPLMLPD